MKTLQKSIDLVEVQSETVSPKRFLTIMRSSKSNIDSVKIVPPRLGRPGFGGISVKYKDPVWLKR